MKDRLVLKILNTVSSPVQKIHFSIFSTHIIFFCTTFLQKLIKRAFLFTLSRDQQDFFPGHFTITSSKHFFRFICDVFEDIAQVDTIFTDFSKVLDSENQTNLLKF